MRKVSSTHGTILIDHILAFQLNSFSILRNVAAVHSLVLHSRLGVGQSGGFANAKEPIEAVGYSF